MNRKTSGGLLGIVAGGVWLMNNYKYFDEQGFVVIGMPIVLIVAGVIYLFLGMKGSGTDGGS